MRPSEQLDVYLKLKNDPERASNVYTTIGRSWLDLKNYERAGQAFTRSTELTDHPKSWVWSMLGFTQSRRKDRKAAIFSYQQALIIDPENDEAHYNLGCDFRFENDFVRAEAHLREAVRIDDRYSIAFTELGFVLIRSDDAVRLNEGIQCLRKSMAIDPDYYWTRLYLGIGLWRCGRLKAAEKQYREAIRICPSKDVGYWCYGNFLSCERHDSRKAEEHLSKAVKLSPRSSEAHYNLGIHFRRTEQFTKARKHLTRAKQLGKSAAEKLLIQLAEDERNYVKRET